MQILVSFRNAQTPGQPLLGLLDPAALTFRVVQVADPLTSPGGIIGIAANDEYLFAVLQSSDPAGAVDTSLASALLVFGLADLRLLRRFPLDGLREPSSVAVLGDTVYVTAADTAELLELTLLGPDVQASRVIWRAQTQGPPSERYRLNSVSVMNGEVIVAGVRAPAPDADAPDPTGFLHNVTRDEELAGHLSGPGSAFRDGDRTLFLEPALESLHVLGEPLSRSLGGFARGLCVSDDSVFVGTSSRSSIDGRGGRCGVTVLAASDLALKQSIDLSAYADEVTALLPLDDVESWPVVSDIVWRDQALRGLKSRIGTLRADLRQRDAVIAQTSQELASVRVEAVGLRAEMVAAHREAMGQVQALTQRTSEMHELLASTQQQLARRTDDLLSRADTVSELQRQVLDGTFAIQTLKRELAQRADEAEKAERALEARLAAVQNGADTTDATIAALRGEIEHRDHAISAFQQELQRRAENIARLEHELRKIHESQVWRVATSYWKLRKQAASGLNSTDAGRFVQRLRGRTPPSRTPVPALPQNGTHAGTVPAQSVTVHHVEAAAAPESLEVAPAVHPLTDALVTFITAFEARFGSNPTIMDWTRTLDLTTLLPDGAVFRAPTDGESLPYFDASVDVIAVEAGDDARLAEARRVAEGCVLLVNGHGGARNGFADRDSLTDLCTVEWLREAPLQALPSVSIVIPVYNKSDLTDACLEALLPTLSDHRAASIVVVDDASTDDTSEVLKSWAERDSRITVVTHEQNRGFIDSCNDGAAASDAEIVLFLNNDTLPQPGWLEPLLAVFRDNPMVGAAGSKLIYADGTLQEAGGVIFKDATGWNIGKREPDASAPLYTFVRDVDYCSGAVLATPRSLFEEIGGFDTLYRPAYYEDVDYCFTVRQRGYRVLYQPDSVVVHLEGGTGGTDLGSGAKQYQIVNHQKFSDKWRDVLATQGDPPSKPDRVGFHQVIAPPGSKRILVSAPLVPEYDREGGSRRLFHLIEYLISDGWSVTFLAPHGAKQSRYKHVLEQMGVATYLQGEMPLASGPYATEAERLIAAGGFDIAIIAFWHLAEYYGGLVRRLSPRTKLIVDSIDLHFVRQARGTFKPHAYDWERQKLDAKYADEMIRELNAYAQADLVLTVSQKEADTVNDLTGDGRKAWSVPLTDDIEPSKVPLEARKGILFLGNFRHPPNVEGLEYLCREIVPLMDEDLLAEHPLWVVGTGMNDKIRSIGEGLKHVHMIGWVPFTTPYLHRSRITAVPLLHGAGMKSKMVQAMMSSTPAVSTMIGVEGMNLVDGEHALIAQGPRAFADGLARLLTDDDLWARIAVGAREKIMEDNSREVIREMFLTAIHDLQDRNLMLANLQSITS